MAHNILQGEKYKSVFEETGLGDFLFYQAEKHKDKIYQIDADLDKSETYSSVKQRSTSLAVQLRKKGINSKDVIVFCSYNTIDNSIPIIASLYLGAKVASLDPTLSERHTKHLLSLVTPRIIFVEEESLSLIENCLKETKLNSEIIVFGKSTKYDTFSNLLATSSNIDTFKPAKVNVQDIAVMFFSSGTTGLPKAICHTHYSFLQLTEATHYNGHDACRILHSTSFYWISGMLMMSLTFMEGGTRVFTSKIDDGENIFRMIEKYKLTGLFAPPVHTYELTNVKNLERFDVSSFRSLITGGTSISVEQLKQLNALFPKTHILFGYGMSEVGIISTFNGERDEYFIKNRLGSCGKVVANMSLKIVNPETEEIFGPNQKGEIRVKSSGLMKGYYKVDSSDCFDKDGFLKTGDVGYYDEDGCLYVVERIKEMFKYLAWHIVPSSIEAVLLEHPAVKETAVFGIPAGAEGEVPAACVVLKHNCSVDKEEIVKFVEKRVSDKEKLRGGITFLDSLPRTPTGKLIRNEVKNIVIKSK